MLLTVLILMKDKEKLQFKFHPVNSSNKRIKTISREHSLSEMNIPSDRLLTAFDSVCEKLEHKLSEQNAKISSLEEKYNDAILDRFDKLITVNTKIGKNL